MAQLVASVSGLVLGGVVEVVGSNLARGKIFTASIGSVDSLYPSVYIYIYIYIYIYHCFKFSQIKRKRSGLCLPSHTYMLLSLISYPLRYCTKKYRRL